MASQNEDNLFEMEINTFDGNYRNEKLPISLFEEIEVDLCDRLIRSSIPEDDQTDFIQNIVDNVRSDFENFVEDGGKKIFLRILSKVFTILLSVKADSAEKIIKIVKFCISTVLKTWSEQS